VGAVGGGSGLAHAGDLGVRLHAMKTPGQRKLDPAPPLGADQQRVAHRHLLEHTGQRVESPADDHAGDQITVVAAAWSVDPAGRNSELVRVSSELPQHPAMLPS
jgi:hypothetical protein